eukprot:bmy_19080T0
MDQGELVDFDPNQERQRHYNGEAYEHDEHHPRGGVQLSLRVVTSGAGSTGTTHSPEHMPKCEMSVILQQWQGCESEDWRLLNYPHKAEKKINNAIDRLPCCKDFYSHALQFCHPTQFRYRVHKALVMKVAHFLNFSVMIADASFKLLHESSMFLTIIDRPFKKNGMEIIPDLHLRKRNRITNPEANLFGNQVPDHHPGPVDKRAPTPQQISSTTQNSSSNHRKYINKFGFRYVTVKQDYKINCTTGLIICDNPKNILVPSERIQKKSPTPLSLAKIQPPNCVQLGENLL